MDNTLSNFDQEFENFKYRWQKLHPEPQAPQKEPYPDLNQYYIQSVLLALVLVATTIVSGFHSIPVINSTFPHISGNVRYITGASAFIMVEGATLLLSYWLAQILFRRVPAKHSLLVVSVLLVLALVPTIIAGWSFNFFSARQSFGFDVAWWLPKVAGLSGSLATVMLFIGGFLFEVNAIFYKDKCKQVDLAYKKELEEFKLKELDPYWTKLNKEFEKKFTKKEAVMTESKPTVSYNMREAKRLIQEFLAKEPKAKVVDVKAYLLEKGQQVPQASLYKMVSDIKQN